MSEMSAAVSAPQQNLDAILSWGLAVIRAIQSHGNPALTAIAKFFTLLGEPLTVMALIAAIIWCLDEKKGFKIGLAVLISSGVNVGIKQTLRVPRPFMSDPSVGLIHEVGFSTPSWHAQNSAIFWPIISFGPWALSKTIKPARFSLAIAIPLCIGASRVYLGVHYPTDVFLGWAIGAVITCIALFVIPVAGRELKEKTHFKTAIDSFKANAEEAGRSLKTFKLAIAALVALAFNATGNGDTSVGGLVFGFAAGYIFLTDRGPRASERKEFVAAEGKTLQKIGRLVIGFGFMVVLFLGLKILLPAEGSQYYSLCRFLRYGIVGVWSTFGAPRVFQATGLA
jgi:membrane-associated phospholipid phosphatase